MSLDTNAGDEFRLDFGEDAPTFVLGCGQNRVRFGRGSKGEEGSGRSINKYHKRGWGALAAPGIKSEDQFRVPESFVQIAFSLFGFREIFPRYAADRRLPHPKRYIRIDYKKLILARNHFHSHKAGEFLDSFPR